MIATTWTRIPSRARLARVAWVGALIGVASTPRRAFGVEKDTALDAIAEPVNVVTGKLAELANRGLELLPLIVVALAALLLFWFIGSLASRSSFLFRWIQSHFAQDLAKQFVRLAFVALGILLALEVLNATALVGATLGAAGVVGIAIGFGFRDLIENHIAGILLSLRHPFAPNDHVVIDGNEGLVVKLTTRATTLLTLDGNHVRVPNGKVFKAVILNYSRNPKRRFDFGVGVGVNEDLVTAQELGVGILSEMEAVLDQPKPFALIQELGDSTVSIRFFAWVDQRATDFLKAKGEGIRLVKTAFDDAEVEMPEPIYRIHMSERKAEAEAESPERKRHVSEGDTSADTHLGEQVAGERAAEGPDLLSDEAPLE